MIYFEFFNIIKIYSDYINGLLYNLYIFNCSHIKKGDILTITNGNEFFLLNIIHFLIDENFIFAYLLKSTTEYPINTEFCFGYHNIHSFIKEKLIHRKKFYSTIIKYKKPNII